MRRWWTVAELRRRLTWRGGIGLPSFLVLDPAGRVARRAVGAEVEPVARLGRVRMVLDSLLVDLGAGGGARGTALPDEPLLPAGARGSTS